MGETAAVLLVFCLLAAVGDAWDCQISYIKNLAQIDAGTGHVVGTDKSGIPYYLAGDDWVRLPGSLHHITVGPAGMWGVNRAYAIYKYVSGTSVEVNGLLKQLDAGGNAFIAGTTVNDTPFCLQSSATVGYKGPGSPVPWTELPGKVKYFSCGPFGCWAVSSIDEIFIMNLKSDCQNSGWIQIDGKLSMIEVASDGSVFGASSDGGVYTRDGITASKPEGTGWTHIPMCMPIKHVSYDLGRLWVISTSGSTMVCTK